MTFFSDLWYAFTNGVIEIFFFLVDHWWWIFGLLLIGFICYQDFKDINEQIIDEDRDLV